MEKERRLLCQVFAMHTPILAGTIPPLLTGLPVCHSRNMSSIQRIQQRCISIAATRCVSAPHLHSHVLTCVSKVAIKKGMIPGPRTLANAQEISTTGGAIIESITKFADGVDEMRKVVREFLSLGVDNIKLSMTGDYVHEFMGSEETYFTLAETQAAVEEAHNRGKRVCAHARSCASVKLCAKAGV